MAEFPPLPGGILCTSITPFTADGRLDEGAMRAHVEWAIQGGCMGINVAGAGYGEGSLLTDDEAYLIYEITVSAGKGKLICSAANLEHATAGRCIEWARMAERAGMEMVRIYPCNPGHNITPTRRMLNEYYQEVLTAVDSIPVMLSSNIITGFEVPIDVHAPLPGQFPQIVAFSKIHQNIANLNEFMLQVGSQVPVFTNSAGHLLITMFMGAKGWHTPLANLVPRLCSLFVSSYQAGEMAKALEYYVLLHKLDYGLNRHAADWGIRPVFQEAGRQLGLATGFPRRPYVAVSDDAVIKSIRNLIDELELRRIEKLD